MAELDAAKTQVGWPVTPDAIKWTAKLLYERYNVPIYVSENGMACVTCCVVWGDNLAYDCLLHYHKSHY